MKYKKVNINLVVVYETSILFKLLCEISGGDGEYGYLILFKISKIQKRFLYFIKHNWNFLTTFVSVILNAIPPHQEHY
jgi:hypothetical protein